MADFPHDYPAKIEVKIHGDVEFVLKDMIHRLESEMYFKVRELSDRISSVEAALCAGDELYEAGVQPKRPILDAESKEVYSDQPKEAETVPEHVHINGVMRFLTQGVWRRGAISYEELVEFAGESGKPSVTYEDPTSGRDGILSPRLAVRLHEGMHFSVMHTGNA